MPNYEAMYFVLEKKLDIAIRDLWALSRELGSPRRRNKIDYAVEEVSRLAMLLQTLRGEEEASFFLLGADE